MKKCAIINPTVQYGKSLINVLARDGVAVTVIVHEQKDVQQFLELDSGHIEVHQADSFFSVSGLISHLVGCDRVFILHRFIEKFDSKLMEQQALSMFDACAEAKVPEAVFTTLENQSLLRLDEGEKSQIVSIYNAGGGIGSKSMSYKLEKMKHAKQYAERMNVKLTQMFLSVTEKPQLMVTSVIQDYDGSNRIKIYRAEPNWRSQVTN
mmetsp:Transcript_10802/g.16062  ORF Transcript_10802/g.16062 Transcript_10802/m.16062 type:complete len:208 (+) Transcript_10802:145-768(+)